MVDRISNNLKICCPKCEIINLGSPTSVNQSQYNSISENVSIEVFGSEGYASGIAFQGSTWRKILTQRRHYCYFKDYLCTWCLRYLSTFMTSGPLLAFASNAPKVIDTTNCDVSNKSMLCSLDNKTINLATYVKSLEAKSFPINLHIVSEYPDFLKLKLKLTES